MTDSQQAQRFAEVYANLQIRFLQRSRQQRARLDELRRVVRDGQGAETEFKELEHIAHTLHGSAGTFGFTELGRLSAHVESLVRRLIKARIAGDTIPEEYLPELEQSIGRLCEALDGV